MSNGSLHEHFPDQHDGSDVPYPGFVPTAAPPAKPPLGLRPRSIVARLRRMEIIDAMARYSEADKQIPQDWLLELDDLNRELKA